MGSKSSMVIVCDCAQGCRQKLKESESFTRMIFVDYVYSLLSQLLVRYLLFFRMLACRANRNCCSPLTRWGCAKNLQHAESSVSHQITHGSRSPRGCEGLFSPGENTIPIIQTAFRNTKQGHRRNNH